MTDRELELVGRDFPIGCRVRYWPVAGDLENSLHNVRSVPWRLGHGAIVLKITGKAGGILHTHLRRTNDGEAA